jgi:SAM-dependent methyltransferase
LVPSHPTNDGSLNTVVNYKAIGDLLDEYTRHRIRGLLTLKGARCLDVVAGEGRMAGWLADEVGRSGRVLATDFLKRHPPSRPNLMVIRHDITQDLVPGSRYDFINLRLVLAYLSTREHILRRLIEALGKGGVLLTQDWCMAEANTFVVKTPDHDTREVLDRCYRNYHVVLLRFGYDGAWSHRAHDAMVQAGLVDVVAEVHDSPDGDEWRGGSPGAVYMSSEFLKHRQHLIAAGMSAPQLDRVRRLLADPEVVIRGHRFISVSGHRPGINPHTIT